MKKTVLRFVLAVVFLTACTGEEKIEVHQVWMRPANQGENGEVYFELHNHSSEPDEIIGVSSDAAEAAEFQDGTMTGDVMEMKKVGTIPVEAFSAMDFSSGDQHVMLIGLKKDLKVGDEIKVTLHFRNFKDLNINVAVRDSPAPEEEH